MLNYERMLKSSPTSHCELDYWYLNMLLLYYYLSFLNNVYTITCNNLPFLGAVSDYHSKAGKNLS